MLTELSIRNFAIIDALHIAFTEGFNVISGETGAGKSIIIGAVSLLLGDRASADMIRTDADAAVVEALFEIGDHKALRARLEGMGLEAGDALTIRRVVSRSGKNRIAINGSPATLATLTAVGESLMNICGQHAHQALLDAGYHIDILDEYGDLLPLRHRYADVFGRVQALRERQRTLAGLRDRRAEREDYLRFQLNEIADIGPQAGEDAELADEKRRLNNVEKLMLHAGDAFDRLYGKSDSILAELKRTVAQVAEIGRIDGRLTLQQDLESLYAQLEDAALTLRDYTRRLAFDPERLAFIDDRLEALGRLKRKHGGTIEAVLARQAEMARELAAIGAAGEDLQTVSAELGTVTALLGEHAQALSRMRRDKAVSLAQAVEAEIRSLNMAGARFEVRFGGDGAGGGAPRFTERGADEAEFFLSTNTGEALKPLNRIASGGELSRIVLAMKKVLARAGAVGTIVFDEVDSGIGGATAEVVGEKLREVARHHQVLCITHLPQIACFADRHYRVVKQVAGGRASACMDLLSRDQRLDEIARMLGGVELTETTRDHAREMLEKSGGKGH